MKSFQRSLREDLAALTLSHSLTLSLSHTLSLAHSLTPHSLTLSVSHSSLSDSLTPTPRHSTPVHSHLLRSAHFIPSFLLSFIPSFICSLDHSFIPMVQSFMHEPMHLFIHVIIRSCMSSFWCFQHSCGH